MSVAYNFEPDVSPIFHDDENFSYHSVHFSSADTPKRVGRRSSKLPEKTLGTTHLYEQQLIVEEKSCLDNLPSTDPLEGGNSITDGCQGEIMEISDEVVADSVERVEEVLSSTKIVLTAGCCLPIRRHLTASLIGMGAEIQTEVDSLTTHVVVDRYADTEVIGMAMKRRPSAPMMVDVKWIQECIDRKQRIQEKEYSMVDCQYLKQTCRRLSSFICDENVDSNDHNETVDFLNMSSTNPTELINQIKKLSERLDALMDHEPIIRYAYHSPDCPTRHIVRPPTNIDVVKIRQQLEMMSGCIEIKRRRSFGGFVYEQRPARDDSVWKVIMANKDCRNCWDPEAQTNTKTRKKSKKVDNRREVLKDMNIINDLRKTLPVDLHTIRETYQKNASISRQRIAVTGRTKLKPREKEKRKPAKPVRTDDSDIESAMASLTICVSPEERREPQEEPLVSTKSNYINQLLMKNNCDDDFISDVSALHSVSNQVIERNGVMFTGFQKESCVEKKLKKIARRYQLEVVDEIDEKKTRCVVSRHGKRTLLVLKAICLNIPIVRPQWLEESFEDSKLLGHQDYMFEEWKEVLKKRFNRSDIFSNVRKIFVADGCQPERKDICWMIEKCGGKVTKKLEKCSMVVIADGCLLEKDVAPNVPIVTPLFIIDSITHNEYLSPASYYNESVVEIS